MAEQLALFDVPPEQKKDTIDEKKKRNWEDGFQRWSNNQFDKEPTRPTAWMLWMGQYV